MLQDIAILTQGEMITEDLGIKLANDTLGMLGDAKRERAKDDAALPQRAKELSLIHI